MQLSNQALAIARQFTEPAMLQHAITLFAKRQVLLIEPSRTPGGFITEAEVFDLGDVFSVFVTVDEGEVRFECDCITGELCRHVVAVFLTAYSEMEALGEQQSGRRGSGRSAPPPPPIPAWKRTLDDALPVRTSRPRTTELCLLLAVRAPKYPGYGRPGGPEVMVRPGERGSSGKWVQGQITWTSLAYSGGRPEAIEALTGLYRLLRSFDEYSYGQFSSGDWTSILSTSGRSLIRALDHIRAAGVPIVTPSNAQHDVQFVDEPLTAHGIARLGLAEHDSGLGEGEVSLRAELRLDGEPLPLEGTYPIGRPFTGLVRVDGSIDKPDTVTVYRTAAPLPDLTASLLGMGQPLIVPPADRADFEAEYLPRLLPLLPLESPDGSYEIPQVPEAALRLAIGYADHRTRLEWSWHRPTGSLQDQARESGIITDALAPLLLNDRFAHFAELPLRRLGGETAPVPMEFGAALSALFQTEILPALRSIDGLEIVEADEAPVFREAAEAPTVRVSGGAADGDWFDLRAEVEVAGEPVEFADLFTALAQGDPLFVLPSGTYFPLDSPEFGKLRELIDEARALSDRPSAGIRVNRHQIDLWAELSELGMVAAQEAEWWLAVQSLNDDDAIAPVELPDSLHATLRDYQAKGVAWLHFLRTHGLGGILADDMGLGKTLQMIAMMELARREQADRPPFLVVAPTSVVGNWARECARFAPEMRVSVITSMRGRRGAELAESVAGADVVLTSYALFRGEADEYRELAWSGLILDEAQQIKNHASHGHRAARTLGAPFTLVITGTPFENHLLELWSLMSLAAPGLLGDRKRFTEFYRTPIEKEGRGDRLELLQRRLRPFLMRRTKDLVASDLPPKQEQVVEIELHPKHRKLYDVRFQRERQRLLGLVDEIDDNRFEIFRSLTLLRQLALDPALVDAGEAPSAKLDALVELLTEAADEGHRVLVLSQFTRFLRAARDRATAAGLDSAYLDGSTTDRQQVIDGFRDGDAPVFFVSLKAGGFGLNLVEADYVVLLDPWWNPAVEEQAIDRTHRIGQTRPVFVYRLVAADTIEQKVVALRESKAELFARVLDGEGGEVGSLSAAEIRELLE